MSSEALAVPENNTERYDLGISPEEFRQLPDEARVCLAFFSKFKTRTVKDAAEVRQEIMEFAGLEQDEVRSAIGELRTENERHPRRLELDQNEDGAQFTVTQPGLDFIRENLENLR